MDLLLLGVAIGAALGAGLGIALLVAPGRHREIERGSLAVLLGFGFVAIASWIAGYLVSGLTLRLVVLVVALGLLAAGVLRGRGRPSLAGDPPGVPYDRCTAAFLAFAAVHTAFIASLALQTQLNWDGIVVWEFKGRITAMSGGVIPRDYFSDASRAWTHPYYPPYYQLLVAWIYGWLGHCDQQLVKSVFPALNAAILGMLFVGGRRLGGPLAGLAAPVVFVVLPEATFGQGGAIPGLLDYTVAAYFLAAAVYVALLWAGDGRALPPLAALCTVMPLIKQEGIVLWAVVAVLAAIAVMVSHPRRLLWALLPGLVLFAAWRVHLVLADTPRNVAFDPSTRSLAENLGRVPVIVYETLQELRKPESWGLLWFAVVLAAPAVLARRRTDAVLLVALVGPVALLSASYVVTNWDLLAHIHGSLPRILVQVAPVAALVVALGLPEAAQRDHPRTDA